MRYIANHYITVNGKFITRGEIFDEELTAQEEERMLRLGAIEKADPEEKEQKAATTEGIHAGNPEAPEQTEESREETGAELEAENEGEEDLEPAERTLQIDPMDAVILAKAERKERKKK